MFIALIAALAHATCPELSEEKKAWNSKALEALVAAAKKGDPAEPIKRVVAMRDADDLCSPRDRYHAAVVLRLGDTDDLESAWALARQAYDGGIEEAGIVAAQARDAALVKQGSPQFYGTLKGQRGGSMCLFPIDPQATDAERAALGQPSLQEVLQDVVDRAKLSVEPTIDALTTAGAICSM